MMSLPGHVTYKVLLQICSLMESPWSAIINPAIFHELKNENGLNMHAAPP